MIIYVNNKNEDPLQYSVEDLAIASYLLQEPAKEIKQFLKTCKVVTNEEAKELAEVGAASKEKGVITLNNGCKFLIFNNRNRVNYKVIMYSFVLTNTTSKDESMVALDDVINLYDNEIAAFHRDLYYIKTLMNNKLKKFGHVPCFNINKFTQACKKNKVKFSKMEDCVIITFDNVKLGDTKTGIILYNRITLYI